MRYWLLLLLFCCGGVIAHEGHEHPPEPIVATTQQARFAAQSDAFELVGVVEEGGLRLYLDRFADNEPMTQGSIEVDLAGKSLSAQPQADGSFWVKTSAIPKSGTVALAFTVVADQQTDLLAANLQMPDVKATATPARFPAWLGWALVLLVGALVMLVLWWTGERK